MSLEYWFARSSWAMTSECIAPTYPRHCEPAGRANARPMTGSAKQSILPLCGEMDCFVAPLLAMTTRRTSAFPRRVSPGLCKSFHPRERRGRRESRVRAAPAVSRARCAQEHAHEHTGSAESIRPSLRNGFTAYGALSSATNSSCHRRCRLDGEIESGRIDPATGSLTPATGAGTTRFCRTQQPVFANRLRPKPDFGGSRKAQRAMAPSSCALLSAHERTRPATTHAPTLPRPPHPAPRS